MINRDDAFRASIAAAAASDDARDGDAERVERMAYAMSMADLGSGLSLRDVIMKISTLTGIEWNQAGWLKQTQSMATAALAALREMEGE